MRRRELLASLALGLQGAAPRLPANQNVKWAVSLALWAHFKPLPVTDILDVMRDTAFVGLRLVGNPALQKGWNTTPAQLEKEMAKRGLKAAAIAYRGPLHDAEQRKNVLDDAKASLEILKGLGGRHLVVFSPRRVKPGEDVRKAFREMCERFNQLGELAGTMGMSVGLHNHLDQMVEQEREIDRFLSRTDPKLVSLAPDTAHLHLAGVNVVECLKKHQSRLKRILDYKDAKWTKAAADWKEDNGKIFAKESKEAHFLSSIYDLGDGEIDFEACHQVLKSAGYKGWVCVDLDVARQGPRKSYERCGAYVVNKLEPVYT